MIHERSSPYTSVFCNYVPQTGIALLALPSSGCVHETSLFRGLPPRGNYRFLTETVHSTGLLRHTFAIVLTESCGESPTLRTHSFPVHIHFTADNLQDISGRFLVPWSGLEPPRGCPHYDLNVARLPIPPPRHSGNYCTTFFMVVTDRRAAGCVFSYIHAQYRR